MDSPFQEINQIIYTQEVVVVSAFQKDGQHPIGECNNNYSDVNSQLDRAYLLIEKLIHKAAKLHRKSHYYNPDEIGLLRNARYKNTAFKLGHENYITSLITNEFMFYTKKRLEPDEFSALFKEVLFLAGKQPENLHLVLSSFPVRALNNKTMNVAVFLECGKDPKIHFIVKNCVSDIDPVYYDINKETLKRTECDNIDAEVDSEENFPKLNINGKQYSFSYNNVFKISTLGGAEKFKVIELCIDHFDGVGRKNYEKYMVHALIHNKESPLPTQISHIVTSNTIELVKENMLEANLTHVDPLYSEEYLLRKSRLVSAKTIKSDMFFGTPDSELYVTSPIKCSPLPFEILVEVEKHNQQINDKKRKREKTETDTSQKKPKL